MNDGSQRIIRNSLHDTLVSHLREMVLNGELQPGEKVPEQQLCQRFDVSRTPMREALKVLAAEGVLRLQMNRGAVVAETTKEEIEEIFPVMGALESLAGKLACERVTPGDIVRMRALHQEMKNHYAAGSEKDYQRLNRQIHEEIVALAGNATLKALYQQVLTRIRCIRFVATKGRQHWDQAMGEHDAILDALEARDGERLGALLSEHATVTASGIAHDFVQGKAAAQSIAA